MSEKAKDSEKSPNLPQGQDQQPDKAPETNVVAASGTSPEAPAGKSYVFPVFLKKDTKKEHPLQPANLDSVIVLQYRTEKIRGREYDLPASDVSAIGIYTADQYAKHKAKGGLFERLNLKHEVWHKPGDTDTVQDQQDQ